MIKHPTAVKPKFTKASFSKSTKTAEGDKEEQMIQWAGGIHQRGDFNKRKDKLADWTNALFSH